MEHAQEPSAEIGGAAVWVDQFRLSEEGQRHRVHGEVAPGEIVGQRRGLDRRQRAGMGVGLAPRACDIDADAVDANGCGAERLRRGVGRPEARGHLGRVFDDRDVEVCSALAAQEIANRSADQPGVDAASFDRSSATPSRVSGRARGFRNPC